MRYRPGPTLRLIFIDARYLNAAAALRYVTNITTAALDAPRGRTLLSNAYFYEAFTAVIMLRLAGRASAYYQIYFIRIADVAKIGAFLREGNSAAFSLRRMLRR